MQGRGRVCEGVQGQGGQLTHVLRGVGEFWGN